MPICLIVVGMAGSGKTTLLTALQRSLEGNGVSTTSDTTENEEVKDSTPNNKNSKISYAVNLDPATLSLPYEVSIDIRDTVDYKQVMQQHRLGPNGAIMTSLNLFSTKMDQVMRILERRAYPEDNDGDHDADGDDNDKDTNKGVDYILVDTPGQIEAFTWSASGTIIGESLASAFPTVLVFVVDTPRCASSPNTFMSNMLYACSMLYRTRLPLVVCFNKTDVVSHEFCLEWMRDHEAWDEALDQVADGFYGSLTRSLGLVLDEFYSGFANACGVSSVTGQGLDEFWETVEKAGRQDFAEYVQDLEDRMEEQETRKKAIARAGIIRLQHDLQGDSSSEGRT